MPPRVGPYRLDRKLGSGGMGTVYLGVHETTGERAAVKILPAALAREEGFRERFDREIAAVKALSSPHIAGHLASGAVDPDGDPLDPAAPDFDRDAAVAFLAMQYIPGETLLVRLRRDRRLPWRAVAELGIQICAALRAAHDAGVVHRDLKPSNLILADVPDGEEGAVGRVVLVDFGVAQLFAAGRLTRTGGVIGTAEFMAPEQTVGTRVTKRCDLYSLGAVLYAALCGVPPFRGATAAEVLQRHRFGTFDAPRRYAPDCPRDLEALLCGLLEKDPADRPADARVVAARLGTVVKKADYFERESDAERARPAGTGPAELDFSERPTRASAGPPPDPETGASLHHHPAPAGDEGETREAAPEPPQRGESLVFPREGPGPATAVRNAVVRELGRQEAPSRLARFIENTWALWALLALVAAGGWAFFQLDPELPAAEMTVGQRLNAARAALEQPAGVAWVRARDEHLAPLLADGGLAAITEQAADAGNPAAVPLGAEAAAAVRDEARRLADRVRRHEIEAAARRPNLAAPPATEAERLLRLAARQAHAGDRATAAETLGAFLAMTSGPRGGRAAQARRIAGAMLADLSNASDAGGPTRAGPPPLPAEALADAREHAAAGEHAAAAVILDGLTTSYAGDPAAAGLLEDAAELRSRLRSAPPPATLPDAQTPPPAVPPAFVPESP